MHNQVNYSYILQACHKNFKDILFIFIYALQSRRTCFEGLWAIPVPTARKVQVNTLKSDLHIVIYMIVCVNCSD